MKLIKIKWNLHLGLISVLIIWILLYIFKIFNNLIIPSPLETFFELIKFTYKKELLLNLYQTIIRIIIAFIFSLIIGIKLGLLFGHSKKLNESTESLIDFLRSVPGIVLFPLFILFFGVGEISRILVAMFVAIPIIIINTKYGVINSKNSRKDLYKIYKMKKRDIFKKIIIPEASPYIFNGIRIAISLIIILIIVTEMMLGTKYGLGQLIIKSQYSFETATMYAVIILLGIIGYFLNYLFNKIETKVFHWR